MTTYRECPFCGKAIEQVVAGHIVPGCKCFTKIERGPRIMPVLIPASIWQSRPYVDALERKLADPRAAYVDLERQLAEATTWRAWAEEVLHRVFHGNYLTPDAKEALNSEMAIFIGPEPGSKEDV